MNNGLLAGGLIGAGDALPVIDFKYAYARTSYVTNPEPVSDTTVKDNSGSAALQISLTLPARSLVVVQFTAIVTKSSAGRTRVRVFDNGVQAAPSGTPSSWYGYYVGENNAHQLDVATVLTLSAGAHVLDVRHQAALSTAAVTWGDRSLSATVLGAVT